MPVIKQRTPWTRQPQVPVGIDLSNTVTAGLIDIWFPTQGKKGLIGKKSLSSINGGSTYEVGGSGIDWGNHGLSLSGSSSPGYDTGVSPISTAGELSVLIVFTSDDSPSSSGYGSPFQSDYFGISFHHTNAAFRNVMQVQNGIGTWYVAKFPEPAAGQLNVWMGTQKNSSYVRAYADGVLNQETAFSVGGMNTTPSTLKINSRSGGYNFNGRVYLIAIWNRSLSSVEVSFVSKNYWQIFAP